MDLIIFYIFVMMIVSMSNPSMAIISLMVGCIFIWFSLVPFMGCHVSFAIVSPGFFLDDFSMWLVYMTLFVFMMAFLMVHNSGSYDYLSLLFLLLCCLIVFMTTNLLILYMAFEASLIPISYIILKRGVYSERSTSVMYMMLYTTFFSFPLLVAVLFFNKNMSAVMFSCIPQNQVPSWVFLLLMLSFMVKLPVYGLHFWLPMAHVEAPTYGSMLLAGVLLKLGGYGVYRFMPLMDLDYDSLLVMMVVIFYSSSMLFSSFMTSMQVDFKRLVAYSSVVHMTSFFVVVLMGYPLVKKTCLMIMLFHGILSPALFFFVGMVYKLHQTRLVYILSSFMSCSVMMFSITVLMFLMSIPTPPFAQFLVEIMSFISLLGVGSYMYIVILVYLGFSLIYNLLWFIPLTSFVKSSQKPLELKVFDLMMINFHVIFILLMTLLVTLL